jgi:hypothetical protein
MPRINLFEAPIPFKLITPVKNADTNTNAVTIPTGSPLVLNLSNTQQPSAYANGRAAGSEDGLQVVLPSTAGAVPSQHCQYGVALTDVVYGQLGETLLHGMTKAKVVLATRAGTSGTSVWAATTIGSASWAQLSIDTVNNAFATLTSLADAGDIPPMMLLDSVSMASSGTATSDTRTVITTMARVFVRMM